MRRNSEPCLFVILAITSISLYSSLTYSYKLTISALVKENLVSYTFVKPIGSYFTDSGLLVRKAIEADTVVIMEKFRELLHDAASKKNK